MDEKIKRIINKWNPIIENPKYKELINELYSKPKIIPFIYKNIYNKVVKLALKNENTWSILAIKGPRRIGKTTLLYYIVKRILKDIEKKEIEIDTKNILYLSLDDKDLNADTIENILDIYLSKKGKKVILLDEASFIPEWNKIIKNFIDRGLTQNSIIIVTGSYGVDLEEAERLLYGRTGNVYDIKGSLKSGAFQFLFPLRFPEIIGEFDIYNKLKEFLKNKNVIKNTKLPVIRELILSKLIKKKENISFLEEIDDYILNTLSKFFKIFILTGGFPKYFKDYIREELDEYALIKSYDDFYQLIKSDAKKLFPKYYKTTFRDEVFDSILISLTERKSGEFDIEDILNEINKFLSEHTLKKPELEDYLDFLLTTKLIFIIRPIKFERKWFEFLKGKRKLYFRDSLIYLAFYSRTRNINSKKELLSSIREKNLYGYLFENVVVRHFIDLPFLTEPAPIDIKSYEEKNLGYYKGKDFEIDIVTWFKEYKGKKKAVLAEVTTQKEKDVSKTLDWINKVFPEQRLMVITEDILEINEDVVFIPAHLILALI